MKAIVILFEAPAMSVNQVKVLNDNLNAAVRGITEAEETSVNFLSDVEVAESIAKGVINAVKVGKSKKVKDEVAEACDYVFNLYGNDICRMPSEDIEKDIVWHICKMDNNHSANLRKACMTIYDNASKARIYFTDKHAGGLLNNICNAINLINGMNWR